MLIAVLVILLICVVLLAAFAIQNTAVITVTFLVWVVTGVPIWVVVTVAAALAALVVILAIVPTRIRRSFQDRSMHQQVAERDKKIGEVSANLSTLQAERDQLAGRLDQAVAEREQLADHLTLAKSERDQLAQEVQLLTAERDRLVAANVPLSTEIPPAAESGPVTGSPPPATEDLAAWPGPDQPPEEPLPPEKKGWWDPRS